MRKSELRSNDASVAPCLQTVRHGEPETTKDAADVDSSIEAALIRSEAEQWIAANRDAWDAMVSIAKREAQAERRFSVRWLADNIRLKEYVSLDGSTTTVTNNLLPALARLMVEQCPSLRKSIEMRRASCDSAFGVSS